MHIGPNIGCLLSYFNQHMRSPERLLRCLDRYISVKPALTKDTNQKLWNVALEILELEAKKVCLSLVRFPALEVSKWVG